MAQKNLMIWLTCTFTYSNNYCHCIGYKCGIFLHQRLFALFSVHSAETSIFYIALEGIIIVPFNEVTAISEKIGWDGKKLYFIHPDNWNHYLWNRHCKFLCSNIYFRSVRFDRSTDWRNYGRKHFYYIVEIYS